MNNLSGKSEKDLLARFNMRDNAALDEVYRLLYGDYFHFIFKMLADSKLDAEDVLHYIFIAIWRNKTRKFDSLAGIKAMYTLPCAIT